MPESDYDDFDDNDLLAAEKNTVHDFADTDFEESPRPHKRQRIQNSKSYLSERLTRFGNCNGVITNRVLTDDDALRYGGERCVLQ